MNVLRRIGMLVEHVWRLLLGDQEAIDRRREVEDLLSAHADKLIGLTQVDAAAFATSSREPELSALMSLATLASEYLYPVRPAAGFQSRLLHDLMRQAHTQLEGGLHSLWQERRREIIIGATITSLISAVGVAAYLMRVTPFNRPPTSPG